MTKDERQNYLVEVKGGLLHYKASGKVIDTTKGKVEGGDEGEDENKFIYVMD